MQITQGRELLIGHDGAGLFGILLRVLMLKNSSCGRLFRLARACRGLAAIPAISAAAAAGSLPGAETVLAIDGPVASRLKGHCGLFSATGTRYRCTLGFTSAVEASPASLVVLFCLAARFAAFWSRIAAFLEKCLIFSGKSEFPATIAAG